MNVLMLNGSANPKGNTALALGEIAGVLEQEGISTEIWQLGGGPLRDCIGCHQCTDQGCVFSDDGVNDFIARARQADGFVFGTPVYYAHPSGRVLAFLDRAFYSCSDAFACKPGAAVAVARRAGTTASLDVMNKYFGISHMPVAGSTYWNLIHGAAPGEASQDEEGLQTMRNLARNLAWMLQCIAAGDQAGVPRPALEFTYRTNFIR